MDRIDEIRERCHGRIDACLRGKQFNIFAILLQDMFTLLDEIDRLNDVNRTLTEAYKKPIEITGEGIDAFVQAVELSEAKQKIKALEAEIGLLRKERDAAVTDLEDNASCADCRFENECEHSNSLGCNTGEFEWRGLQREAKGG